MDMDTFGKLNDQSKCKEIRRNLLKFNEFLQNSLEPSEERKSCDEATLQYKIQLKELTFGTFVTDEAAVVSSISLNYCAIL